MDDEESPFSYDECYKWLVENGVDEIHIYDSTAEDEMVGEFLEAMFPIEDDANEAYDKAAIAVDNLGFTFDDFLLMDWDEIADEVRTEMESVIITIAPIDPFEDFFENHFWESLKNRFEIRNGSGPYKPCIALVKEDGKRSEDPFFDNVYMSVATMYACLIPQIVAKMNRRMSALNSFCRLAGLPVFHCGQGDLCHPTMVLKEAGLYPTASEAPRWAEIAKDKLEYFIAYVGKYTGVLIANHTAICNELRSQVKLISEAVLSGETLPTYLIEETEL